MYYHWDPVQTKSGSIEMSYTYASHTLLQGVHVGNRRSFLEGSLLQQH